MTGRIPRVSIGLPVYNGENFIRLALDSILRQDYSDFELIISDNASTDTTPAICQEYAARDTRIRYYRNEANIGASGNYNRVFQLARGGFFKWVAHDDICLPGFLSRCVSVLENAPSSVVLVAPMAEIIDEQGREVRELTCTVERLHTKRQLPHQRIAEILRNVTWAVAQSGLIRADALRKTRLIDAFYASDYVLLVELASIGEIWEIPEVLLQIRFHPGMSTRINKNQSEMAAWFNPSQKTSNKFLPPTAFVGVECLRSIHRMPLPIWERFLCYAMVVIVWGARECLRVVAKYRAKLGIRTRLANLFKPGAMSR